MKTILVSAAAVLLALFPTATAGQSPRLSLVEIDAIQGVKVRRIVRDDRHLVLVLFEKENELLVSMPFWKVSLNLRGKDNKKVGQIPVEAFNKGIFHIDERGYYRVAFDLQNELLEHSYLVFISQKAYKVVEVSLGDLAELPEADDQANKTE